ncbi:MAG TPA: hypothetical protein VKT78_11840 [Fimbriimonadaceae bacterium]|nr:hypothetical protein [Fimbriimonadaceae bacterium]
MGSRVFSYRKSGIPVGAGLLLLFGAPFVSIGLYSIFVGGIPINNHEATRLEDAEFGAVFALAGMLLWLYAGRFLMTWKNERIEVSKEQVVWIDWRGRERLRSARDPRLGVAVSKPRPTGTKFVAQFADGVLEFSNLLPDFVLLKLLLERPPSLIDPASGYAGLRLPPPTFTPPERTYGYRFGAMHVFSFLWLAVVIGFASTFIASGFSPSPGRQPADPGFAAVFLLLLTVFLLIGVWMQLTGWREQISLGASGITWVDYLGRTRVSAALEDILDVDLASSNNASSLKITTTHGVVQASSNMSGFSDLRSQAQHVVASRHLDRPRMADEDVRHPVF